MFVKKGYGVEARRAAFPYLLKDIMMPELFVKTWKANVPFQKTMSRLGLGSLATEKKVHVWLAGGYVDAVNYEVGLVGWERLKTAG